MAKVIAFPVMVLSALGVLASFVVFLAGMGGNLGIEKGFLRILFPGIFIVWVPTVLLMNRSTRDFKQRDIWKAALRGCPAWMRMALWVVVGLVFAAFFAPFLWGSRPEAFPAGFLLVPAVFYSVSFCVMYSTLHMEAFDAGRQCLNGHRISPLAKFCEECGAPAAPEGMQEPGKG
jgi:hypothetical protein